MPFVRAEKICGGIVEDLAVCEVRDVFSMDFLGRFRMGCFINVKPKYRFGFSR